MRGSFAWLGQGHRFRQEKPAAISCVPNPFWNSGTPGKPSGFESILKQESCVEFLRAELAQNVAFVIRKHHVVAYLLIFVDGRNIGPRKNRYPGVRKARAHSAQRRQRHDGVANPIRGAN
jgi:hypothetical protein